MRDKNILIKTMQCLIILALYYIIGNKNIFPYVLSLSLYNIFISSFSHITIKESLKKIKSNYTKNKLLKILIIIISIISLAFLLLSIVTSDIVNTILNINDIFLVFLFMGLTVMIEPILNILLDYIENTKSKKLSIIIYDLYHILDFITILIIAIFTFRIYSLKNNIAISLLYLSKVFSILMIITLLYLIKDKNKKVIKEKENYNYKLELKKY